MKMTSSISCSITVYFNDKIFGKRSWLLHTDLETTETY